MRYCPYCLPQFRLADSQLPVFNEAFGASHGDPVKRTLSQQDLLEAIYRDVACRPDHPVSQTALGNCLVGLRSCRVGLASLTSGLNPDDTAATAPPLPGAGSSARQLAAALLSPGTQETDRASLAMAAANSLLPPPKHCSPDFGQDVLAARGRGKNVAVIGHFPFVDAARPAFANFWVLEKHPQPGDHDATMAHALLPQADLVAVTATTLLNGTLAGILNLCRSDALVILLGPTTPFAPSLFDCGIDILAGCDCHVPEAALAGVRRNLFFRKMEGVRQLAWEAAASA